MENTFLIPSSEPGADLLCKKTRLAEEKVNALDKASCCSAADGNSRCDGHTVACCKTWGSLYNDK